MLNLNTTVLILLLLSIRAYPQAISGEIELNGFQLGQYRYAVHAQLGVPAKRINTDDGWIYEFHIITHDSSVYALFKYPVWDTLRIYSIQINGHHYTEMHPFRGLQLGASKDEVDHVLGAYQNTDTIDGPTVVIQSYENKNYSVEIDETGKLYGIQIYGSILKTKPPKPTPDIDGFTKAIRTKNTDSLLLHLAPDVELFVHGAVLAYKGAAREEFNSNQQDPSEFMKYLFNTKESVWSAFEKEKSEGSLEFRLYTDEKIHKSGMVYKFYNSKILSEIVYMPYAGRWKVYEIKFRN